MCPSRAKSSLEKKVCTEGLYREVEYVWTNDSLLISCKLPILVSSRHFLKFLHQAINGNFTFPNTPPERRSISSKLRSIASSFLLHRPIPCTNAYQYSFFFLMPVHYGTICLSCYTSQTFFYVISIAYLQVTVCYCDNNSTIFSVTSQLASA